MNEARRQKREEDKEYDKQCEHNDLGEASVRDLSSNRVAVIDEWVTEESTRDPTTGYVANADQQKFLIIIAKRMKEEARDLMEGCIGNSEPLSLLCMGGPGVGKSYISKSMRRLFDKMNYEDKIHYQFAAYQAVVAEQLDGDTLHHFAGVGVGKQTDPSSKRAMNNLRWLIIDEVSQVSADLLASVEANLRVPMQDCGTYKIGLSGRVRDYGGINIVYIGDFMQLPPVRATSLDTIPPRLFPTPFSMPNDEIEHALELLWSGVTEFVELTIQERCKDYWYMAVQQECRVGNLSERNHKFLHGLPTGVPGCWMDNVQGSTCSAKCAVQEQECGECIAERERRCRVFDSGIMKGRDNRMASDEFRNAVAIVANNDLKDQICKQGTAQFARDTGQRLLWSYAVDQVKNVELAERADLRSKQNEWLQYADNKCDGLIGSLPLAIGATSKVLPEKTERFLWQVPPCASLLCIWIGLGSPC